MDNTQTIQAMKNAMQRKGKEYKEAELIKDPVWHEASALVYKMKEGKAFKGSPEDLAKYGIDKMSEFNYNVSFGMVPDVMDIEKADMDTKIAFAYMMDTYDKKDATLEGFGRAVKELALDPTSYAGIGTLGAGFAMRKTGAELVKEGLKNRLMGGIKKYLKNEVAVGATEGALYTAGDNLARQKVYKESGMTSKISKKDIAISAGLGAVAGGGIVKGVKLAGKGIDMANKAGEEAMAISAGGGTPTNTYIKQLYDLDKNIGYIKTTREGDIINIDDIEVFKTGTGIGTNEIKSLMRNADRNGHTITLTSDAMRGKEGQKKNRALYEKLGFIKNAGKNKRKDITEEYYYQGVYKNEE